MADYERTILEFYQLPNSFPSEWPAEKDAGYQSGEEEGKNGKRRSRFQALESATLNERKSAFAEGQGGVGNIVSKDEQDPLGTLDSVVRTLKQMGLPVQDDSRLRNRFLLSSTTFSPALFLSQVHSTADTNTLLQGLDVLSQSIDQKSASLKVLVESNFERFVKAKATIDNVYKEMKYRGIDPTAQTRASGRHSRQVSRSSGGGFRLSGSAHGLNNPLAQPMSDSRKKNALVKESEYGVMGIKVPLLDVSARAEDVWGPALGNREREQHLRKVADHLDGFKDYVELSAAVSDGIKRKDYESLVESYNKARKFADETRKIAKEHNGGSLSDAQLYKLVLAGRMWNDVDQQMQSFKTDVWKKLVSVHGIRTDNSGGRAQDQHTELISLLLELGVDDSPIWVWLLSNYDYLKSKIKATSDRSKVEIEVLRRRLANNDKPAPRVLASHLRTLGPQSIEGRIASSDSADVIELWDKNLAYISSLVSAQGILGELVEFWQTAQGFVNGKTQRSMPVGYNGESRKHHSLSREAVTDLEKGMAELVEMVKDSVQSFFMDLPPEDISLLFSPLPMSPNSPISAGPNSAGGLTPTALTPTAVRDPRFNFDANNPPLPSTKRGESWEKLAFWPPWANSISGAEYLSKMLALVGSGASEMASLGPVASGDGRLTEQLKTLVSSSRERCVTALCAAWNRDAENIKYVEDWQRPTESGDVTRMPVIFAAFEASLLSGMQKILYMADALEQTDAGSIVSPPPTKLLQMVRSQYVTTLYKALSGMVENAERSLKGADDDWAMPQETIPASATTLTGKSTLDAGDRNIRMLLTMSNLQALRSQVVPSLNSQFENAFSVKLTDESKTIRDVLGQIDARLFQSYTKQSIEKLREIVERGITAPDWAPPPGQRPTAAKPYIYELLLTLVLVHSQLSTTAASLTPQVLSFLLEKTSTQLLEAFRKRPQYSLEALMQATLDVEFVAQTLSHYTTERASELQSQIYQDLDGRTDNDARSRLQNELPEMRNVLKKLREASKNEFACFKKPKRAKDSTS